MSPEETYHAWYDRIDPDHLKEVAESVAKMTAGMNGHVAKPIDLAKLKAEIAKFV